MRMTGGGGLCAEGKRQIDVRAGRADAAMARPVRGTGTLTTRCDRDPLKERDG
jgi:hypothetical protein